MAPMAASVCGGGGSSIGVLLLLAEEMTSLFRTTKEYGVPELAC